MAHAPFWIGARAGTQTGLTRTRLKQRRCVRKLGMGRILIVDYEHLVRDFLRVTAERAGHEVIKAADAERAVQAIREQRVDLVISDLLLPGRGGLEVIRTIRSEFPDVPMVALGDGSE
jgi:CheY-like chemotaxis protein